MKEKLILFTIFGIVVCAIMGGGLYGAFRPQTIDPSKDSINMIQPCTSPLGCTARDERNAEHINVPNSQANKNNADANLLNAQATEIASDMARKENEMVLGGLPFWCSILALSLVAAAIMAKKG